MIRAADLVISTEETRYDPVHVVGGRLIVEDKGSLTVFAAISADLGIINNSSLLGITTSGTVTAASISNASTFVVQGPGDSIITGGLHNQHAFTFGAGGTDSRLRLGSLSNDAGARMDFLPGASMIVTGAIGNGGDVSFQMADFEVAAGSAFTNSGNWTVTSGNVDNWASLGNYGEVQVVRGDFTNRDTTNNVGTIVLSRGDFHNNASATVTNRGTITLSNGTFINQGEISNNGGTITLTQGDFQNQTGATLTNAGTIRLESGAYRNQGATINVTDGNIALSAGDFQNQAGATVTNDGSIRVDSGKYTNAGTTTNHGTITLAAGNLENQSGAVNNSGTTTLQHGDYVNQAATNNQTNGLLLLSAGNFHNQAGAVTNDGEIRVTQGNFDNEATTTNRKTLTLSAGNLENRAGATVTNAQGGAILLSSGNYSNRGTTENLGRLTLSAGDLGNDLDFTNRTSGVVTVSNGRLMNAASLANYGTIRVVSGAAENSSTFSNYGNVQIDSGNFLNQSGGNLMNDLGASIALRSGTFENQVGATLRNFGAVQVSGGDFNGRGTVSGDGQLNVNGTANFFAGSLLEGNPAITATTLNLQGSVGPGDAGGVASVGRMTFNADTHVDGLVTFDLVTPGDPGTGNDLIRITGGQAATLESGAQFDLRVANPLRDIGDRYEIIRGKVAMDLRPLATDDVPGRRIVLRTDHDVNGFTNQGTAYYALVARDASFGGIAALHGATTNVVTLGNYLDMALPLDDRTIGTTNADLQWMRDTLDLMPLQSSVVGALGQLTGEVYASLSSVALQRQFIAYQQFAGRIREDLFEAGSLDQLACRCKAAPTPVTPADGTAGTPCPGSRCCGLPVHGWVSGYGYGGALDGDANADGVSYGGGGLQVAFGYQVTERFGFGIFYDFGAFKLDRDPDDEITAGAHSFGGYLAWHRDVDYLLFVGGGGIADYDSTRYISFSNPSNAISRRAKGDFGGGQAAFYGEYGRNIEWENVRVRPYLGLLYMTVLQDGFAETEAGGLNLSFEDTTIDSFRTLLGTQCDFRLDSTANLVWTCHGVWVHEYVDDATAGNLTARLAAIPDTGFTVAGPTTGRDWLLASCGVRGAFLSEHLRPFANYDLAINTYQSLHSVGGGLEYVW